ncbi:MAG TPA: MBL fold metallo-hydrolase [Herpetosiphonaceae bacterium]|nr:MBL fold metallo-hydrolase [Herpetosiphonaceae bacterium]
MPDTVRLPIGALTCTVLCDGTSQLAETDLTSMFPGDGGALVDAFRALPEPRPISRNILLVETAGQRVLIDAGQGQLDPDDPGRLLDALGKLGITAGAIDTVIISHYHLDHIGGLLDGDGNPTFRNARLVVPKREHEVKMREEFLAQLDPFRAGLLRRTFEAYADRLDVADGTEEIAPGVRYADLPGHTPGHTGVLLESQGARLLHVVDAIHLPIQLNHVDAVLVFDAEPDRAVATRRGALERVEADETLLLAYHFPFPGVGRIARTGEDLRWDACSLPSED